MKLEVLKFGLATMCTAALLWVFCTVFVLLLPSGMLSMSGHMVHMNLSDINWHLTLTGFLIGLFGWSLVGGGFGWLVAFVYNRLVKW